MNNQINHAKKWREEMALDIIETAAIKSLPLIHAFMALPRERFVPFFLENASAENASVEQWVTVSPQTIGIDAYLQKVYTDTSLVVQVDYRGWPCSSSSMPSIMAVMLEALDVRVDQNVLEIGTGSGYNAAILAYLTRNAARVTTIDHENARALSQTATQALHEIVGPVHTIIGDGFQGVPTNAPYDRIIATASAPTIPTPWIEQLAPDGMLVMDVHGPLESGFFVFKKNADGISGHGHFLDRPLHFMPLVSEHVSNIFIDTTFLSLMQQPHQQTARVDRDDMVTMLLNDRAFRWFLQWYIPSCNIVETVDDNHNVYVVVSDHQSILQLNTMTGIADVFGTYALWDVLQEAFQLFASVGNPPQTAYSIEIDAAGRKTMSTPSFYFQMK